MVDQFFFIHSEWSDTCYIDRIENSISRKNIEKEFGNYEVINDKIIIKWHNWPGFDEFILYENIYFHLRIYNEYIFNFEKSNLESINLLHSEWEELCFINKELKIIFKYSNFLFLGNFKLDENGLFINWNNNSCDKFIKVIDKFYQDKILADKLQITNNEYNNKYYDNNENSENQENHINSENSENNNILKIDIIKIINNKFYSKKYLEKNKNIKNLQNQENLKNKNINNKKLNNYNVPNINLLVEENYNDEIINKLLNLNIKNNYLNKENVNNYKNFFNSNKNSLLKDFFSLDLPFELKIEKNKKRSITLVEWGYPPFGGGENWMLNFNKILYDNNYDNYLISFSDPINNKIFDEFNLIDLEYVKIIQMPKDILDIIKIIKIIDPLFINHQGINRMHFLKIANILNIPFLTGFCFWNDIINYSSPDFNIDMLNNNLEKSDNFKTILDNSYTYVASHFVNDVISKVYNEITLDVIESISIEEEFKIDSNINEKRYVTLINCHYKKGGYLIKILCQNLDENIPLQFVYTEYDANITIDYINNLINERNLKKNINILIPNKIDIKTIYKNTKILLIPSLCDETFCRVAYEGMINKIPILSTRNGNLKYILKDYAIFIENYDLDLWKNNIEKIYYDEFLYNSENSASNENTSKINNNISNNIDLNIENIKLKIIKKIDTLSESKYKLNPNNIGLIIPWADQGLGIQGRDYYLTLKNIGFNPFVLSFKPYHSSHDNIYLQSNRDEWNYENITYSPHYRENLTYDEIADFIYKNNIKKIIIIEATFIHIFKITAFLKLLNIEIYLVVNIECIRIDELNFHNLFDKILTNNKNSDSIITKIFNNKSFFLGFHLNHSYFKNNLVKNNQNINYLKFFCIGGLNSISRKHIDLIVKIFYDIYVENIFTNWTLNVYVQGVEIPEIFNKYICKNINFIIDNMSYETVISKYKENDIFIHFGSHEGLGLGFYESLYCGTPILTMNWIPNNELIINNYNGWLVDTTHGNIYDNSLSLINRGVVSELDVRNKIIYIIYNKEQTLNIIDFTLKNKEKMYLENKDLFEKKLKKILLTP